MRSFFITICIGFVLIIALFIRIIGTTKENATSHAAQTGKDANGSLNPAKGLSKDGKVRADASELEPLTAEVKLRHEYATYYDEGRVSSEWVFEGENLKQMRTFYPDGATWSVSNFNAGQLHGEAKVFYPSGEIQKENYYSLGKLKGLSKQYYERGLIWIAVVYRDGAQIGFPSIYSQDGSPATRTELSSFQKTAGKTKTSNENALTRTLMTSFYSNKTASSEWGVKNKKLDGLVKIYYESGKPWCQFFYDEGELNGESKCFYESGEILSSVSFTAGKQNGYEYYYYQSGAKWIKTLYANGKIEGLPRAYSENGESVRES